METNYLESVLTQEFTITAAQQNDVVEALYIAKVTLADMIRQSILHKDLFSNMLDVLSREAETHGLYLYRKNSTVLGFMTCGGKAPEGFQDVNWENKDNGGYYVSRICVHPRWRNQGIGSAFLSWAEEMAKEKGYKSIRLDISSSLNEGNQLLMKNKYKFAGSIFINEQKTPISCYEKAL